MDNNEPQTAYYINGHLAMTFYFGSCFVQAVRMNSTLVCFSQINQDGSESVLPTSWAPGVLADKWSLQTRGVALMQEHYEYHCCGECLAKDPCTE